MSLDHCKVKAATCVKQGSKLNAASKINDNQQSKALQNGAGIGVQGCGLVWSVLEL